MGVLVGFRQTFVNGAVQNEDEIVKFCAQKVEAKLFSDVK